MTIITDWHAIQCYTSEYMKKPIIVFDLDGVLFDSIGLLKQFNAAQFVEIPEKELLELFTGNIHETIKHSPLPKKIIAEDERQRLVDEYVERKLLVLMYPKIKELVEQLTTVYTLAINTYARPERSLPLLEREKIIKHFDYLGTYNPDGIAQTKIEKFKAIAKKYNIEMQDMLFITDSLGDVREVATLAVPTIAVTWGMHDRSFFEREAHPHLVAIVDTVEELKKRLLY